jgi:glyoxylase-like metal-dependent hydrolase (beta-lactamase superfamily II)
MSVEQVAPGLSSWVAYHQEWKEGVRSYALATDDGLVLIDPLEPPRQLRRRRPDHVLLTTFWHARSTRDLRPKRVWAPARSVRPLQRRGIEVSDPFRPPADLPRGLRALPAGRPGEAVYWLPEQRALVAGDVLLGGPLRICPDGWVGKGGQAAVRAALEPLLELPIERVLVSHGQPVLARGRAALRRALAQAPSAA